MENSLKLVDDDVDQDEVHIRLVDWVEEAEEALQDSRDLAERCRDYYDGDQWTEDELKTLEERKQPAITINRIKPKVDYLLGMEREFRQDPKAFPRTPEHEKAAGAATDAIRYVCDNVNFDAEASSGFADLIIEGTEAVEVIVKSGRQEPEIHVRHVQWDRLIWDHHSRARDFSDSRFLGGVIWMDTADAKERWPDQADMIESAISTNTVSDTYDDSPRHWVDAGRKRIKIVHLYWMESGVWTHGIFTGSGWLTPATQSPYLDEGKPVCPLIMQSSHVDRNGNRYGAVRQLLDIQDEINHRRSKALHMLSTRQTFSSKQAAGEDIDKLKRELAKADGHLEFEYGEFGKDFGILPNGEVVQTQFQLLAEAKTEIDAVGANAAMAGDEERAMSGRALLTRQKGGTLEIAPLLDSHRMWKRRVYRAIWHRIQQFWQSEKWIRVTDDEQNLQWVGLNKPITAGEMMARQGVQIPPQFANDPRLQVQVAIDNQVAELDVDIILDEQPDLVTLQSEQFDQLAQMYQANPQGVPFDLIVEASSLRNKDQLLKRLRGGDPDGDPEKIAMTKKIQELQQGLEQTTVQMNLLKASEQAKMEEVKARIVESQRRVEEARIRNQTTQIKAQSDVYIAELQARTDAQENETAQAKNAVEMGKIQTGLVELMQQQDDIKQNQACTVATMQEFMSAAQPLLISEQEEQEEQEPETKLISMSLGGKRYVGQIQKDAAGNIQADIQMK